MMQAQTAPIAQGISNYTTAANNSVNSITNQYGLPSTTTAMANIPGGANKPYSDYQPPSAYSKWNNLQLPSSNGTINPYTAYVKPVADQQSFNAHISEQINGVRTMQSGVGSGTPGVEVSVGGNGLANPNAFQSYSVRP
jgi:hypothetical protein